MREIFDSKNAIGTKDGSVALGEIPLISGNSGMPVAPVKRVWRDALIGVILCVFAAHSCFKISQRIDSVIFDFTTLNIWFDADVPRNFIDMNTRDSEFYTSHRHPLLPLLEYPPVYTLKKAFGLDPVTAVHITLAAVAGLWVAGFFAVLRFIGCRRLDALLFSLLGTTSAAAMFWFVVPETPLFASVTILFALGVVAMAQRRPLPALWYVIASAATLSVTVTDWMFGIFAAFVNHPWRRWLQITLNALCVVVLFWVIQKYLFPNAVFFFGRSDVDLPETESGGPLFVLGSFLFHGIVMPAIKTTHWWFQPNLAVMTVQPSFPGSASIWSGVAALAWIVLLGLGLWALWTMTGLRKFRLFLGLSLAGQLALHLLYARETFLYSLHFAPLLIVLASLTTFTRVRSLGLVVAAVVAFFGGINNTLQLGKAIAFVRNEESESYRLQAAVRERPKDPWPRGALNVRFQQTGRVVDNRPPELWPRSSGHVLLGSPGSREVNKAYEEPGGSFSPAVGSFGVSIWVTDENGNPRTTSDNMPLNLLREQFIWNDAKEIPGILTDSPYYRAQWSAAGPGAWALNLKTQSQPRLQTMVVLRSVGPAGGPITSLELTDWGVIVNDRWNLRVDPRPIGIQLGEEDQNGWVTNRSGSSRWTSNNGWGYARIELAPGKNYNLVITDSSDLRGTHTDWAPDSSALQLELPDERFAASLNAQVAHLLMGLVDHEARPGDPMSYPFAWLRDEAYIVSALAQGGRPSIAKQLSKQLAEKDFFGGFGAEADAPGLAIWALANVAMQLRDPDYDVWVWPHIRRKAELILNMLSTDRAIHTRISTPVIPLYTKPLPSADPDVTLVSEPSRDGLIIGRIDNSRPVLYVNAVSHLGLIDAATVADRVGAEELARQWRARASELKQAWSHLFDRQPPDDSLTLAHILWPTWMASTGSSMLVNSLEDEWAKYAHHNFWQFARRNPFTAAQAHEWLLLGRGDHAWTTLTAFWDHQESPGLYTWPAENSPENTYNRWKNVRGWLKGQDSVTPSYTAAAEILLLQLDMLAYVDKTAAEPTLVIGAGIQPSWLEQRMRAQGLSTPLGQVDWTWDRQQMRVRVYDSHAHVRLGPGFSPNTPLNVEYVGR
jgi:hypothetical protein